MTIASIFTPIITGNMIYHKNLRNKSQNIDVEEIKNDFEIKLENSKYSKDEKNLIIISKLAGYNENDLIKQFNIN